MEIDRARKLLIKIADLGRNHPSPPDIYELFPFRGYFGRNGQLLLEKLGENDGLWSRRELITRYLLLQAVLDQGPDIVGIRLLLRNVINALYKREVRILHRPLDFFKEIGISIDEILARHESVREVRSQIWAEENKSNAKRYNLFMDNSKQVLGYAIYRWGVPLSVPYLLEKDKNEKTEEPLVDYLESWDSAEQMSRQIKDNERYGLGKAVGDKACHLFTKWYIHSFHLVKKTSDEWGPLSYELPLDSNAGRVLFRTGFWFEWATRDDYENWQVIQKGKGKRGVNYIRVTNIRGKKSETASTSSHIMEVHSVVATRHFKSHARRPQKIEIQQIPNTLLYRSGRSIGELDDGLIYIGTNFCLNHDSPKCGICPIRDLCNGYQERKDLISNYRT